MCIIVYKPKSVKQISKKTLNICFENNDDGAGYTFWNKDTKTWTIHKGFMSWDAFWNSFKENDFQSEDIWAAHFRIATSGKTDGGNTHPFPVCDSYDEMRKTDIESDTIVFHNGVMGNGEENVSDTMKHIKDYLEPIKNKISNDKFLKIFSHLCDTSSNRWFIANKKTTLLLGDWKKFEGSYYSNTSYKKVKTWKVASSKIYSYGNIGGYSNGHNHDCGYFNRKNDTDEAWWKKWNKNMGKDVDNNDDDLVPDKCPVCGEKEYVVPSMFSEFILRCYSCGAVFDPGTGNISFFVPVEENIL